MLDHEQRRECNGDDAARRTRKRQGLEVAADAGLQERPLRVIELDAINPQVAARLARALDRWSKLAEPYRSAAREAIARVAAKSDLSSDVREIVERALA